MNVLSDILIFLILGAVVIACIYFFIIKIRKKKNGLKIADTPSVVIAIREIAQLVTASFFEEKVLVEKKTREVVDNAVFNFIASKTNKEQGLITDELCLIAKGQVKAGYDLTKISENDIHVIGKTLHIRLPKPEVLDVIINPKGWDFYVEEGTWLDKQVAPIKQKAKDAILRDALDSKILEKAAMSGEKKICALMMSLGFKEIKID